jgi:protein TonB
MALVADALSDLRTVPRSRSALPVSLLLHGALLAAAMLFMHPQPNDDPAELDSVAVDIITVQTPSDGDILVQSDAAQTVVAAGAKEVAAEPIETLTETVEPVREPIQQPPVETLQRIKPVEAGQPLVARVDTVTRETSSTPRVEVTSATEVVEQAAAAQPATVPLLAATEPPSPVIESVAEIAPVEASAPEPAAVESTVVRTASAEPPSAVKRASIEPLSAEPSLLDPPSTEHASVEPARLETLEPAIEPEAKPKPPEPAKRAQPQSKPKKPLPKKQAATGGAGGKSDANAQSSTAPKGGSGKVATGGSGSESRYPGLVQARLKHALRSPPGNQQGQAHVSFLVHADGSVSDIQIAHSTGSSALDAAALATVRRAAPFPPIPADANRSSWSFTLPLRFR